MRGLFLAAVLALSACAASSASDVHPVTSPAAAANTLPELNLDGDVVMLAFSGGGARAAAFSLGALQGLRDMHATDGRTLLDHVRLVTSVSGGSITAAYFGQHGEAALDTFRAAYLDKDWGRHLHTAAYSPLNWSRAASGGLNGPHQLADWLDREVFSSGSMNDAETHGVRVILNSTDLYNGTTFAFAPPYFDAICADLGSVRIADAVAASMAVPVAFEPVLAAPYPDHCATLPAWAAAVNDHAQPALMRRTAQAFRSYRDPAQLKYVHLVDGGVLDNLGLTSLALMRETAGDAYGPMSEQDAVRVRRLSFIVVNAEKIPSTQWQLNAKSPSGPEIGDRVFDVVIEGPNRSAFDAFRLLTAAWERDLRTWRCTLPPAEVVRLRGSAQGWDCNDVHIAVDSLSFVDFDEPMRSRLGSGATAVSLDHALVDDLIASGRSGIQRNGAALALTH